MFQYEITEKSVLLQGMNMRTFRFETIQEIPLDVLDVFIAQNDLRLAETPNDFVQAKQDVLKQAQKELLNKEVERGVENE